ncbi:MAG TPA: sugar ABC transporter substrate-binding protein, partial [Planctomycetaceae bacterium]|nr:sugar ABC transporter substrate-binding protein [Planctomycetaceae bacterium]
RDFNPERYDEPGQIISGEKYTILGTRTDNFDFGKAKSLAEDAIVAHPDMGAMIGLFAYNPPNMLEALKSADKIGQIKVIG